MVRQQKKTRTETPPWPFPSRLPSPIPRRRRQFGSRTAAPRPDSSLREPSSACRTCTLTRRLSKPGPLPGCRRRQIRRPHAQESNPGGRGAGHPRRTPEMSSRRGSDGKRLRMSPSDAEGSPKRSRSSRRRSPSPSLYSPSSYLSHSPSPSPYRSPSPSPCRSWSRRLPSDGDDEEVDDRSRTRGSDEIDGHARPVWRPHADREQGELGHGSEFSVQIDDYDRLFTCRSCRRMLSSPVYQCPFAHVTCSRCHDDIGDNRCNSCGATDGYGRNHIVEEFLTRIRFSCRNKEYGCSIFLPHNEMPAHEQTCRYEPSFCPIPRCGFAGRTSELGGHLRDRHHWDTIRFHYDESFQAPAFTSTVFRSVSDGELFFLDSFSEGRGTALSMICIRPENACEQEFNYELRTPAGNSRRRPRLQIESTVRNTSMRHGMGEKEKVFLLVPNELPGSEDGYVDVRISKVGHRATP